MSVDEFKQLLLNYGSACEAYGAVGADPDCRSSTLRKYEIASNKAFDALVEMYEAALEEKGAVR